MKKLIFQQEGQILAQTVIMIPLLILFCGLVFDGGLMYVNYRRAEIVALTSAQAAGHAIDEEHFLATQEVRLNYPYALAIASEYAAKNSGGNLHVTALTIAPQWIDVTVEGSAPTIFMRMFGFGGMPIKATARAYPGYGISGEGQ